MGRRYGLILLTYLQNPSAWWIYAGILGIGLIRMWENEPTIVESQLAFYWVTVPFIFGTASAIAAHAKELFSTAQLRVIPRFRTDLLLTLIAILTAFIIFLASSNRNWFLGNVALVGPVITVAFWARITGVRQLGYLAFLPFIIPTQATMNQEWARSLLLGELPWAALALIGGSAGLLALAFARLCNEDLREESGKPLESWMPRWMMSCSVPGISKLAPRKRVQLWRMASRGLRPGVAVGLLGLTALIINLLLPRDMRYSPFGLSAMVLFPSVFICLKWAKRSEFFSHELMKPTGRSQFYRGLFSGITLDFLEAWAVWFVFFVVSCGLMRPDLLTDIQTYAYVASTVGLIMSLIGIMALLPSFQRKWPMTLALFILYLPFAMSSGILFGIRTPRGSGDAFTISATGDISEMQFSFTGFDGVLYVVFGVAVTSAIMIALAYWKWNRVELG